MERKPEEVKDFDAKEFAEDSKILKKVTEWAMKEDLARNQMFEKWWKENFGKRWEEVKPLANGDWQYGNESLTVSYSDRTESEEK